MAKAGKLLIVDDNRSILSAVKLLTESFFEEVLTLPDITVCPHGRPIAFALTKRELDRQFDRIK